MAVCLRFLSGFSAVVLAFFLTAFPPSTQAYPIGGEYPCATCVAGCNACNQLSACGCALSNSQGNARDGYSDGMMVRSAFGATLDFSLVYNSKIADGSHARIDTVMGYGWTHSYNILLFAQRGHMFRLDADGRVTKYTLGPGGAFTATTGYFETLVRNPDDSFTLRQKDGTTFDFAQVPGTPFLIEGPVYRLLRITDRNNNVTTLAYDGAGQLTTVTDTYGRRLTLGYTGNELATVTDPLGRVTRFSYAASGSQLAAITDPEGHSVNYRYNSLAQIVRKTDRDGRVFTYGYRNQKPVTVRDGSGSAILTLSNPGNWATNGTVLARDLLREYVPATTSKRDGRGNLWRYQYDIHGYLTRVIAPDGATMRYTYDPATLLVATETDANNHTTSYQYDALGNMTRKTDHLGHVTTYTYEPVFSQMTSMTDANGRTTTYEYDSRGNRIKETDPFGETREWTYDSHGNVLTEEDKNGNVTTYEYDAFGNRMKMTDAVGNVTEMKYDAVGNMVSLTNARGFTTGYDYDGLNRLVKETDAVGNSTVFEYDGQGNRVRMTDREGNATVYEYDLRQRLVKTTDALDQMTSQTYDGNDNRTSFTDKNDHTTTFEYDVQNRLVKTTDAEGNMHRMAYDPVGNKISETDANDHTTTYVYDALDRQVRMTDAVGNVTQMFYDMVGLAGCAECTGPAQGSSLVTQQTDANGKV
ncbi:MAG: DUF6531 domain-containing protein, partial [Pseudomonadota bacterium]|nr:DUF6531 domain-containing protein [Pseudomonadota bacterium]